MVVLWSLPSAEQAAHGTTRIMRMAPYRFETPPPAGTPGRLVRAAKPSPCALLCSSPPPSPQPTPSRRRRPPTSADNPHRPPSLLLLPSPPSYSRRRASPSRLCLPVAVRQRRPTPPPVASRSLCTIRRITTTPCFFPFCSPAFATAVAFFSFRRTQSRCQTAPATTTPTLACNKDRLRPLCAFSARHPR